MANDQVKLEILTPKGVIFSKKVNSVIAPGKLGSFGILPGHAPLISSLGSGNIVIDEESGNKTNYKIDSGFLEVLDDLVTVLANSVDTV